MHDRFHQTYSDEPLPIDLPDEPMTVEEIMGSMFTWRDFFWLAGSMVAGYLVFRVMSL